MMMVYSCILKWNVLNWTASFEEGETNKGVLKEKRSLNTFGRHITITFLSFAAAIPNESCTNIYAPCDQISSGAWRVNSVLLREQPSHCLIFFVLCLLLKCIALTWEVDSRRETSLGTFYNILLTVHAV